MKVADPPALNALCDCVVMLTWSDWQTEPRGNRYHWATRLARHLPVLFVQPDAGEEAATLEDTEVEGVRVLHLRSSFDIRQVELLSAAIRRLGYRRPLLWIYNVQFFEFIARCFSPLKIYHATEDYFVEGGVMDAVLVSRLKNVLQHVDLIISVSELVNVHYIERGGYSGPSLVLSNGCDLAFWSAGSGSRVEAPPVRAKKVALYQGGINWRLDWDLLEQLIERMTDWEFWFCGRLDPRSVGQWNRLTRLPNLRYFGDLRPEKVRDLARDACVGLIPFAPSEFVYVSMPLKAFEYVASGLTVVSVPIKALEDHPEIFDVAHSAEEFARAIERAEDRRDLPSAMKARRETARLFDYDERFREFLAWVDQHATTRGKRGGSANLLVLYDPASLEQSGVRDRLQSVRLYSRHRVFFAAATSPTRSAVDLSFFDGVVVDSSVAGNVESRLTAQYAAALKHFPGLKLLFMPDEFVPGEGALAAVEDLGIQLVFSGGPTKGSAEIHPPARFSGVECVPLWTAPASLESPSGESDWRERIGKVDAVIADRIGAGSRLELISILRGARYDGLDHAVRGRSAPPRRGIATDIPLTARESESWEANALPGLSYLGASSHYSLVERLALTASRVPREIAQRLWRTLSMAQRQAWKARIRKLARWTGFGLGD